MAIAFDAAATAEADVVTSITYSHTTAAGSNRVIVAGTSVDLGTSVSSATHGGSAMSSLFGQDAGSDTRLEVWYRVNQATGANNVVFNYAAASYVVTGAASYTGVNQTTTFDTPSSYNSGTTEPFTRTISSASGDLVLDWALTVSDGGTHNLVPGSGQTERWQRLRTGEFRDIASSDKAGAASVVMEYSDGATNLYHSAYGAVNMNASGGTTDAAGDIAASASATFSGASTAESAIGIAAAGALVPAGASVASAAVSISGTSSVTWAGEAIQESNAAAAIDSAAVVTFNGGSIAASALSIADTQVTINPTGASVASANISIAGAAAVTWGGVASVEGQAAASFGATGNVAWGGEAIAAGAFSIAPAAGIVFVSGEQDLVTPETDDWPIRRRIWQGAADSEERIRQIDRDDWEVFSQVFADYLKEATR